MWKRAILSGTTGARLRNLQLGQSYLLCSRGDDPLRYQPPAKTPREYAVADTCAIAQEDSEGFLRTDMQEGERSARRCTTTADARCCPAPGPCHRTRITIADIVADCAGHSCWLRVRGGGGTKPGCTSKPSLRRTDTAPRQHSFQEDAHLPPSTAYFGCVGALLTPSRAGRARHPCRRRRRACRRRAGRRKPGGREAWRASTGRRPFRRGGARVPRRSRSRAGRGC